MIKIYKNLYLYLKRMDKEIPIKLTNEQQKIFNMLIKYRDELGLKTVLRVAGGWVRDKVLGRQSKDIDIALDNMKGQQFVMMLKKHAENNNDKISGFGVTKFNPQLSKHLQTATAKIDNHWIDFVNLRCQEYNQDSRIPTMIFGTPLQDAQRRDFTINSLFYNLDTQQVEDCTQKGLSDLHNQIIRTPLEPLITFKDDPLRILRCLRFKSRLDFKVDEKIYEAMSHAEIKEALLKKVSKQRVGIQLGGLLRAQHFMKGLQDIRDYGLWNIVFEIPKDCDLYNNKQQIDFIPNFSYTSTANFIKSLHERNWYTQKQLITEQQESEFKPKAKKKQKIQYPATQLQFLILLSSLTFIYRTYEVKINKAKSNLVTFMVKDQLKYSAKQAKFAQHFAESVDNLNQIKSIDNIYEIIRWLRFAEEKWELSIHFLCAYYETSKQQPQINLLQLREEIIKKNLGNSYLAESPVDGTFLTKKGIKGPAISKILQNAIIWRIINPNLSNQVFQKEFQEKPEFFMSDATYR